jgi:anaerobic magnesium-protoporphyrin IX monomethyl ester cyclase
MSTDVLLIQLVNWYNELDMYRDVYAPIGLAYISSSLRENGYSTILETYRFDESEFPPSFLKTQNLGVIGISGTGNEIQILKRLSILIRMFLPSIPIVVGGYCSLAGEDLLEKSEIDIVVIGEGEETMLELVQRLLEHKGIDNVAGIIYRRSDGNLVRTIYREGPSELDRLPIPTYNQIPRDTNILRIYASRGCPYQCTFCEIKDFYGRKPIRYHSSGYIKKVVSGLLSNSTKKIDYLYFNDDEFLLDKDHLIQMAGVARDFELKICFQTRVHDVLRCKEVINQNRDVIHQIHLGIESFSQSQLNRWKKGVCVADNKEAIKVLSQSDVSYYPYIILSDEYTSTLELYETCEGMLSIPECPILVRKSGHPIIVHATPVMSGIYLNRMKNFYGEVIRIPQTSYLEPIWNFILSTNKKVESLNIIYLNLLTYGLGYREDLLSAIDILLRKRIEDIPRISEYVQSNGQVEGSNFVNLKKEDFISKSQNLIFDFFTNPPSLISRVNL